MSCNKLLKGDVVKRYMVMTRISENLSYNTVITLCSAPALPMLAAHYYAFDHTPNTVPFP